MKVTEILFNALVKARNHLEYCGYGDSWEREIAKEQGLSDEIEEAIKQYKEKE